VIKFALTQTYTHTIRLDGIMFIDIIVYLQRDEMFLIYIFRIKEIISRLNSCIACYHSVQ
jgi:hypothetical protein